MSQNGEDANIDHVEDRPPTPPPVPAADNGVIPVVGPGPEVPGILVPGGAPPFAQAPMFGAHAGFQPVGHQNLLQHAQAGQLRQDQLHLIQEALVSVQGMPPGFLSTDNCLLKKAKRECDISAEVALYSNPMSKRAIEHIMRLSDLLSDVVSSLSFGGTVLQATSTNYDQVNGAISSVLTIFGAPFLSVLVWLSTMYILIFL
jgi:hypothetical protein